jgi:hypothetical protein
VRSAGIAALLLAASSAATAQEPRDPLATRPGWELGGQVAYYDYREPNVAELDGYRLGAVAAWTVVDRAAFAKLDLRASYGPLDYRGSGTMSGVPDLILETRILVGFDLIGQGASLSPYAGWGYRFLYDDLRGYSSTNAKGYRRYSNYVYVPIGLTMRLSLGGGWSLVPTLEADVFMYGKQNTKLSDFNPAVDDVSNRQDTGRGHRVSIMFERDSWAFGAWNNYWHIDDSQCVPPQVVNGVCQGAHEPQNYTREYGLELRYRF